MKFLHICRWWRVLFPPTPARTPALSLRESICLAPAFVAQICNLLYRRIAFCEPRDHPGAQGIFVAPQNAILRYSRLQICATNLAPALSRYTGEGAARRDHYLPIACP